MLMFSLFSGDLYINTWGLVLQLVARSFNVLKSLCSVWGAQEVS